MKVIYIHIETSKRDYLSRLLLSFFATRMGFKVLLGDVLSFFKTVKNLKDKKGIFHFKDIAPSDLNLELFQSLKNNGFLITSIDEEGGIEYKEYDSKDFNSFLTARYSNETLSLVDQIFTWGEFDYKSLIENFPQFKHKFINTGNPRLDFCKLDFDKFYEKLDIHHTKNAEGPILIMSDIGNVMSAKNLSQQVYINREAAKRTQGKEEKEKDQLEIYSNKILYLSEFIQLINQLTNEFPDQKFLLRPHPTESKNDWIKILGNHKNLEIVIDGDATSWIRKSKLMIHNSCYTAIDGAILKKPIISFCPPNCIKSKKYFTGKIGIQTNNINQVIDQIKNLISNPDKFNENISSNLKLIQSRLNIDSLSSKKQVEIWSNLFKKDTFNNFDIKDVNFNFFIFLFKMNYLIKNFIKKLLRYKNKNLTKIEELDVLKVKRNLNFFDEIFNEKEKKDFKITKISKYLCFIETL